MVDESLFKKAEKVVEAFEELADDEADRYNHTSALASEIWRRLLVPEGQRILEYCRAEKWKDAFGSWLGLLLVIADEDELHTWLSFDEVSDPETGAVSVLLPCQPLVMRHFFAGLSVVSEAMLEMGGSEIGLLPSDVETLEEWIKETEDRVNNELRVELDGAMPYPPRLRIFSEEGSSDEEDEATGGGAAPMSTSSSSSSDDDD